MIAIKSRYYCKNSADASLTRPPRHDLLNKSALIGRLCDPSTLIYLYLILNTAFFTFLQVVESSRMLGA